MPPTRGGAVVVRLGAGRDTGQAGRSARRARIGRLSNSRSGSSSSSGSTEPRHSRRGPEGPLSCGRVSGVRRGCGSGMRPAVAPPRGCAAGEFRLDSGFSAIGSPESVGGIWPMPFCRSAWAVRACSWPIPSRCACSGSGVSGWNGNVPGAAIGVGILAEKEAGVKSNYANICRIAKHQSPGIPPVKSDSEWPNLFGGFRADSSIWHTARIGLDQEGQRTAGSIPRCCCQYNFVNQQRPIRTIVSCHFQLGMALWSARPAGQSHGLRSPIS